MKQARSIIGRFRHAYRQNSIQFTLALTFTAAAIVCMVAMGLLLYNQFASRMRRTILQENEQLVNQIAMNVENYTRNMRAISDSMYYDVIKNTDLGTGLTQAPRKEMGLLYSANKDLLISVACFTSDGTLVAAAPNESSKAGVDVTAQDWFITAREVIENNHFSTPHVQNLFEESSSRYRWVISLSRMVELTTGGVTRPGVLLVDMNYSGIERIFTEVKSQGESYYYLIDKNGEIVYHPKQKLIYSGLYHENNLAAAGYTDGMHEETFGGVQRQVVVKSTGYTGWRIVSVIPNSAFAVGLGQMPLLAVVIVALAIMLLAALNTFVSRMVANPIKKLDKSVGALDKGELALDIYVGGPQEVEHLGTTIRKTVDKMRALMDDVVYEQEEKRKTELDALHAQINPHFLYNTLDSIVWMIESNRYQEAISMVTALASLFRISLAKGANFVPLKTELQHASYYLHIQNIRYKNKFSVVMNVDPAIEDCMTIKLIVQPLLENAIYHAMEMMDGDGVITINGKRQENGDVLLEVRDNGLGMPPEVVARLLDEHAAEPRRGANGSGIGLRNVDSRLRLYYGPAYGLSIHSVLDEGTAVQIRLPYRTEVE